MSHKTWCWSEMISPELAELAIEHRKARRARRKPKNANDPDAKVPGAPAKAA